MRNIISAYPNPASDILNVSLEKTSTSEILINVTNVQGQIVHAQRQKVSAGRYSLSVNLTGLPASTYILSIIDGTQRLEQKFIKR
jgi:hypothetical protein